MTRVIEGPPPEMGERREPQTVIEYERRLPGLGIQYAWPVRKVRADTAGRYPGRTLVMPQQQHTNLIELASSDSPGSMTGVDGLVFMDHRMVAAVTGADCPPIIMQGETAAAILHAGWRGTLDGITTNAVEAMVRLGEDPRRLKVVIGPSIGPCHFEVGPEVLTRFGHRFGQAATAQSVSGLPSVNLQESNRVALIEAGIDPHHVIIDGRCTHCHRQDNRPPLPSYRRDRHVSQLLVVSAIRHPEGGYAPITPDE